MAFRNELTDAEITAIANAAIHIAHIDNAQIDWLTAQTIAVAIELTAAVITGAEIRTAVAGSRIEITGALFRQINLFTGNAHETTPARIEVNGAGLTIEGPDLTTGGTVPRILLSVIEAIHQGVLELDADKLEVVLGAALALQASAAAGFTLSLPTAINDTLAVTGNSHLQAVATIDSLAKTWTAVAPGDFLNGWTNFVGHPWGPARYFKDPLGIVHMAGVIIAGPMNAPAFQFPAADRPQTDQLLVADVASIHSRVDVDTAGFVRPGTIGAPAAGSYAVLDNLSFPTD